MSQPPSPRQPWSPCVLSLVFTGLCCLVPFLSEESFHLLLCLSPSSSLWHLENSSPTTSTSGFLGGSVVKNPSANAGDAGHVCSIPGSGRSPGGRNGNPLQCSCLGNPKDRGARWGYSPWGCKELGMAEHPHTKVHKPALPENVSMCYQNNELRTEEARPGERGDLGPQRPPNGACHPLPQQEATSAGPGPPWPSSAWCSVRTLGRGARPSANMHQSS